MYSKNVKMLAITLFLISGTISTFGTYPINISLQTPRLYKCQGGLTRKKVLPSLHASIHDVHRLVDLPSAVFS